MATKLTASYHFGLLLVAVVMISLLGGCASSPPTRDPYYAPVEPSSMMPPESKTGAIFQSGYEMSLFEDLKAQRVGDIITIILEEKTDAKKTAKTNVDRASSTEVDGVDFLGFNPKIGQYSLSADLQSDTQFEGAGDSLQNNSLRGSISATVVDVLPNGNLVIRGEKRVGINQGTEYVRIGGIVRPIDLAADNTVSSTKVADATISYVGEGALADSNRIGWLARFFIGALWPF